MRYDQEICNLSVHKHGALGLINGKKVIAKKDRQKDLINIVKESKMFEHCYKTSLATTMLM